MVADCKVVVDLTGASATDDDAESTECARTSRRVSAMVAVTAALARRTSSRRKKATTPLPIVAPSVNARTLARSAIDLNRWVFNDFVSSQL